MKAKKIMALAFESGTRFELYSPDAAILISSTDTLFEAYTYGFNELSELNVDSIAVVNTPQQPETLQIYTKAD